ncbi:hypothetical protein AB6A40_008357 [Gnathostoma spinigerum]|uniref:Uncharacterized protein n=1 Tax=Gnathostoma spinigerum TaxID=75299 RepID=A0ABD6EP57_9BILA
MATTAGKRTRQVSALLVDRIRIFEDNPTTVTAESQRAAVRTVTPSYKTGSENVSHELKMSSTTNLPEAVGDYKVKETQDHFKLQIIDPKVNSNSNIPASSRSMPSIPRRLTDFPSEHTKRSFLKLEPLEQRRIRSSETRPITTSAYLTESVDRHRNLEASRLRDYLRTREGEASKPWNKPSWPGPKVDSRNDESLRELEEIKKKIEALQKVSYLFLRVYVACRFFFLFVLSDLHFPIFTNTPLYLAITTPTLSF